MLPLFFSLSFEIASDITVTSADRQASSGNKIAFACQAQNKSLSSDKESNSMFDKKLY